MERVKCECGHINPHGTVFCENCGRTINEKKQKKLLDMRYEGSARRSQTYNKTVIDKIWNFFSSVKVGVWLIVITLVASAVGTIYPQEMYIPKTVPAGEYYKQQYGFTGKLFYQLGFHDLYRSWWYILLVGSIGISLVICSLDRVIPLYRALKKQGVTRHESFLRRQRLFSEFQIHNVEQTINTIKKNLGKRNYKVREENGNILAEKGRFSRWGPYINHIGLIIFLLGTMLRSVPGMYIDEEMWIREGETKSIPGTNGKYYLKSEKFVLEVYEKEKEADVFNEALTRVGDQTVAKNYQTNVILFERIGNEVIGGEPKLKEVKTYQIRVNKPLKHDHYALYQVDFKLNEFKEMSFYLVDKATEQSYGKLTVDLRNPEEIYDLGNGYIVELEGYFQDFYIDDAGEPNTKSKVPNNPVFVFKMITPDKPEGERSIVAIQQNIEPFGDNKYKMSFAGIETINVSALTVRKDTTLWLLGVGGFIFMVGVIQGMYWQHRRIWLQNKGGHLILAGHTNKNWYGLKTDIKAIMKHTELKEIVDQAELENAEKEG